MNKIKVLIYEPNRKEPTLYEIDNSIESFQAIVDGQIEWLQCNGDIRMVCNEAGKLLCLEPSILFDEDVIAGTCFFVRYSTSTGFYKSLTEVQQSDMIYLNDIYNTSKDELMKKAKDTYYTCDQTKIHQKKNENKQIGEQT